MLGGEDRSISRAGHWDAQVARLCCMKVCTLNALHVMTCQLSALQCFLESAIQLLILGNRTQVHS